MPCFIHGNDHGRSASGHRKVVLIPLVPDAARRRSVRRPHQPPDKGGINRENHFRAASEGRGCSRNHSNTPHSTVNYELFNSNNVSIHYWSWNYRGCWHQTCPPIDTHVWVWVTSIGWFILYLFSMLAMTYLSLLLRQCVSIEQFARLLPSLGVVAVSHAPSSESNSNFPSPVTAVVASSKTNNGR